MHKKEKPPRQWAAEIVALKTLDERRAALQQAPDNLRPLIETHIKIAWEQKRNATR